MSPDDLSRATRKTSVTQQRATTVLLTSPQSRQCALPLGSAGEDEVHDGDESGGRRVGIQYSAPALTCDSGLDLSQRSYCLLRSGLLIFFMACRRPRDSARMFPSWPHLWALAFGYSAGGSPRYGTFRGDVPSLTARLQLARRVISGSPTVYGVRPRLAVVVSASPLLAVDTIRRMSRSHSMCLRGSADDERLRHPSSGRLR